MGGLKCINGENDEKVGAFGGMMVLLKYQKEGVFIEYFYVCFSMI